MNEYIGPVTKNIIHALVTEFKKDENKDKISNNIINPIVSELFKKIGKYYLVLVGLNIIIILILIYIVYKVNYHPLITD